MTIAVLWKEEDTSGLQDPVFDYFQKTEFDFLLLRDCMVYTV